MKKILLVFIAMIGIQSTSFAKTQVCLPCKQAGSKVEQIEKSGIKPNPFSSDSQTQEDFVTDSSPIISRLLDAPNFSEAHAEATLRLLKTILPFDVAMFLPQDNKNGAKFKKMYGQSNSILAKKLDALIKAGTFQEKHKNQILEYMGVIPANGALENL